MKKRIMKISLFFSLSVAISSSQAQFSAQAIREAAPRSAAITACVAGGSLAAFSLLHGVITLRRSYLQRSTSQNQMQDVRASLLRRNFYRLVLPALALGSTGAFFLLKGLTKLSHGYRNYKISYGPSFHS